MKFNQTATLWKAITHDGFGLMTHDAPTEIKCRWELVKKIQQKDNEEISTDESIIYMLELPSLESYIFFGISTEANPRNLQEAFRITCVSAIPNLKDSRIVNKVSL